MEAKTTDQHAPVEQVEKIQPERPVEGMPEGLLKPGRLEVVYRDGRVPVPSSLSLEEKIACVKSMAHEIIQESELVELFKKKEHPICYDGFEPSGRMHIAQGILKALNVNKLTDAGCIFVFWVADWFALLNNKMGGDLHKVYMLTLMIYAHRHRLYMHTDTH